MARNDYFTGRAVAVGWALQAVASGTRWDGTPGTARYSKPMSGGMSHNLGADQTPDDTMDVDPASYTTGATKHNGTIKQLLSYEHQELLMLAIAGAADSVAGSGPYVHTLGLADPEVYITVYEYFEDFKGTRFLRTYTNAIVTELTIEGSPEQRPVLTISWAAQSVATSTPGSSPTEETMDLVDWDDLTVTINSATACVNSLTFTVTRPVDDSDVTMGCDAPNVNTLFGNGQRTAQMTTETGLDDTLVTIMDDPSTAVAANITFTDGASGAALRKLEIDMSAVLATAITTEPATWGKRKESINWVVSGWSGFEITNSLSAAQV